MTSADFNAWLVHMAGHAKHQRERLPDALAAQMLGCSRNTVVAYREGLTEPPQYIGLACAALAFGLPPWKAQA